MYIHLPFSVSVSVPFLSAVVDMQTLIRRVIGNGDDVVSPGRRRRSGREVTTIGVRAGGADGAAAPRVGQNIFFGQSSNFSGSGQKTKNNILKITHEKYEKYEKYSIRYNVNWQYIFHEVRI